MSGLHELPERIFRLIESGVVAEFSTVVRGRGSDRYADLLLSER